MMQGADRATIEQRADAVAPIFAALSEQGRMKTWLCRQIGCTLTQLRRYEQGVSQMPSEAIKASYEALGLGKVASHGDA